MKLTQKRIVRLRPQILVVQAWAARVPLNFKCLGIVLACLCWIPVFGSRSQNQQPWAKDYFAGLAVWRKPGQDRTPCAFCHSPDGIELAAYAFSDDTIRRRAIPHVGKADSEILVKFVHAVRDRYGLKQLMDPLKDRPLQPGGSFLGGRTPLERDAAFASQLERENPALFERVDTLEKAKLFASNLSKIDPSNLKVGIEFNRLSEDRFHGTEHATIAHWFPDTPFRPQFSWDILFAVHDQYLANPSDKAIGAMEDFAPQRLLELSTPADQMAIFKYCSLTILQHELRMKALGKTAFAGSGVTPLNAMGRDYVPNFLWGLGEFASEYSFLDLKGFHLPDKVIEQKTGDLDAEQQLKQLRLAWLWAGWLLDQPFARHDFLKPKEPTEPRRTRLLTETLFSDGPYPMHAAFMVARKAVLRSSPDGASQIDADFGAFTALRIKELNLTAGHRTLLERFAGNASRTLLLLGDARGTWPKDSAGSKDNLSSLAQLP